MSDHKYAPSNRLLLESAVKHLETLNRRFTGLAQTLLYLKDDTARGFDKIDARFAALVPAVWAADRLVHEKETLVKQLATARRNLAEANAFINRPVRQHHHGPRYPEFKVFFPERYKP